MNKWPEIEQFRHIVKKVRGYHDRHHDRSDGSSPTYPTLLFRGTVKTHGTNVGISRLPNGSIQVQSRNNTLSLDKDLYGIVAWVSQLIQDPTIRQSFDDVFDMIETTPTDVVDEVDEMIPTVFAEYVGPGIQKSVGVSQLPEKQLILFGASLGDTQVEWTSKYKINGCDRIHNTLDFPVQFISINFNNPEQSLEHLEQITLSIEAQCPVAKKLGVEGIGEGLVWTCMERPTDPALWFKTKGEKHCGKGKTDRKVATVSPEKLNTINEVVDSVVTQSRLAQGLEHIDSVSDVNTGQYIKWVTRDILKEESDLIIANGLEWKEIVRPINSKVREYFLSQVNRNFN